MKSKENIRFMKKNKNLQGCVSIEREREQRWKRLREGASVTLVQSKWKVETVYNQGER